MKKNTREVTTTAKRLSYNVPLELAAHIRQIADEDGVTPAYLLRKMLESAIHTRLNQSFPFIQERKKVC
jgi:predicted DNA-binding protein